ncbi:MAG: tetratricopeptide repeat protein [Elusimicrobia bacterium]|nr:tetratricopeptide repeat protein [Elusimicrobiota bacterium]
MVPKPDPLDAFFAEGSGTFAAEIFRGYIAHSLLFYRQNDLRGLGELRRIGREFRLGPGGETGRPRARPPTGPGWSEAARGRLDEAIRLDPRQPAFLILRGFLRSERCWGSRRLGAASIADFEAALALDGDQLWARMGLGMAWEMRRRYVRAIAQFDAASSLAADWSWPLVFRGVCLWYLAEFRASVSAFGQAARLDASGELPLLFLARAKADLRDRTLVADLDRALTLAPRSGFALSWRGRAMFVLKRAPRALADLRASIKLLPDYDRGWSWLGVSLAEQGQTRRAAALLMKARALNAYYPTTLYPLAGALMSLKRWDEAGRIMREAAAVDRSGVWIEHRISMSHPNPAALRSRRDLDRYLERRPRAAWALAWRGQTELLLQNYWRAIDDLDRAVALAPRDAWARLWRGEARRRLGLVGEARADFESALRLDARLSWAHAGRGACLLEQGRVRAALAELERSLRLQPHCGPAHAFRGRALLEVGRPVESAAAYCAALELHPRDRWISLRLAESLARCGAWEEALAAYGRGGPSDADAAMEGFLLARAGRGRQASRALEEALRRNPRQPLALYVLACRRAGRRPDPRRAFALRRVEDPAASFAPEALARTARSCGLRGCAAALLRADARGALARAQERPASREAGFYRVLAWLKLSCGDARGALEETARSLDAALDPEDAAGRWLRARILDLGGGTALK